MNYDGRSARKLRGGNAGVFAGPKTAVRTWPDGTIVRFDQLFEMLFMVERIDPPHGIILLLLTGILPHHLPPDDLLRLQRDEAYRASVLAQPRTPPGGMGGSEAPFFSYVDALRRAAAVGATVLISY